MSFESDQAAVLAAYPSAHLVPGTSSPTPPYKVEPL